MERSGRSTRPAAQATRPISPPDSSSQRPPSRPEAPQQGAVLGHETGDLNEAQSAAGGGPQGPGAVVERAAAQREGMEGGPDPLRMNRPAPGRNVYGKRVDVGRPAHEAAVRREDLHENGVDPVDCQAVVGLVPRVPGQVQCVLAAHVGAHLIHLRRQRVGRALMDGQVGPAPGDGGQNAEGEHDRGADPHQQAPPKGRAFVWRCVRGTGPGGKAVIAGSRNRWGGAVVGGGVCL
jgi:hypothetical protein